MKKNHMTLLLTAALMLMLCLGGCGTDKNGSTNASASPSATATVSPSPMVTEQPDSQRENPGSADAAEDGKTTEAPAENTDSSAMPEAGSEAGDDLKRAGEDLGDAAREAGRSVEDGLKGQ